MVWCHGLALLLEMLLLIPVTLASFWLETLLECVQIMEHGVAKSLDVNVSSYQHTVAQLFNSCIYYCLYTYNVTAALTLAFNLAYRVCINVNCLELKTEPLNYFSNRHIDCIDWPQNSQSCTRNINDIRT